MKKVFNLLFFISFSLTGFSQVSARACATIINKDDLVTDSLGEVVLDDSGYGIFKVEPIINLNTDTVVLIGYTQTKVLEIKGEPISKIDIINSCKEKWIYNDLYYYFNESKVELIQTIITK